MVAHQSFTACLHFSHVVPNSLSLQCIWEAAAVSLLTGTLTMESLPCSIEMAGGRGEPEFKGERDISIPREAE